MGTSPNRSAWQVFSEPDFNELERELDRIEPAWADFAHGVRTGMRFDRACPTSKAMHAMSFVAVRQQFDVYRVRFESGTDPAALLLALKFALTESVPVPYWVASAVRERLDAVLGMEKSEPVSLHDAFGLREVVPLSPKRYANSKRDLRALPVFYKAVSAIMQEGRSLDAALRQALRDNRLGIGITKAREMFEAQDRIQRQHLGKRPRRRWVK